MFALSGLFEHHSVADRVERTSLDGGATLYRNGDRPDAVYLLRSGLLIVLRDDAGGRPQLVGYVRAGECVGEMGVLAQGKTGATRHLLLQTRTKFSMATCANVFSAGIPT